MTGGSLPPGGVTHASDTETGSQGRIQGIFLGGARIINNKGWHGQSMCAHVSAHQGGSGGPPPEFFLGISLL